MHGTQSDSSGNWFQWLKNSLEERGYAVWVPDLPSSDMPSLREWTNYIFENTPFEINAETVLIGHSSGAVAVLVVAQLSKGVDKTISVGAYKDLVYLHEELDFHANDRFFDIDFDFEKIKQNSNERLFIHSDDDPYCPLSHAEYLAEKTDGEPVVIPNSGHFNLEKSEKFKEFPQILSYINSFLLFIQAREY